MPKRHLIERYNPVLVNATILAIVMGVVILWLSWVLNTPAEDYGSSDIIIPVEKGMTLDDVSKLLDKNRLLRNRTAFKWAARLMGVDRKIQPGYYLIPHGSTNVEILRYLLRPMARSKNVTIPEGLTIHQIAGIFQRELQVDSSAFVSVCEDSLFALEIGVPANRLEGYLFPDTYNLNPEMPPEPVIRRMVNRFFAVVTDSLRESFSRKGLSLHQAVTLASIIEGEIVIGEEAPLVSAVYHNRIKKRMPLEADPTIQYIIPDGPRRLYRSDLALDSPYNTYRRRGLPPGPISNPGARSLYAAGNPANVDYLFFVAQGDGSHAFTRSYEEFLQAKGKLQKIRRELALKEKEVKDGEDK